MSIALAVAQFALPGIGAVVLIGFAGVQLFRDTGTEEAIRDAKEVTRLAGEGIVGPRLTRDFVAGRPAAVRELDRVVRASVLRGPVVRVKIWDASGRILYSDVRALTGTRYRLGKDELESIETGGVDAELSDLSQPENRFERRYHKLLEVYQGVRTPSGRKLLFEEYHRFSSVSASGQRLWRRFAPALIGALLLLELVQLPLAWSLARRLRRGQQEREALLRRAIEASDTERRRIARDLHDGVVQSIAGVALSLSAAADELSGDEPREAAAATLRSGAQDARQSVRELRTLLVDIYPPSLHREGLAAALSDVLATAEADGVATKLDVTPRLSVPEDVEALLFRVGQEAVRNALAHADPGRLDVSVAQSDGVASVEVADDGRGFDGGADGPAREGHFGLRMLRDLARDAGGTLTVDSAPGRGTRVRAEVPVG